MITNHKIAEGALTVAPVAPLSNITEGAEWSGHVGQRRLGRKYVLLVLRGFVWAFDVETTVSVQRMKLENRSIRASTVRIR